MNKNWLYVFAVLLLPMLRLFINELHGDDWLRGLHYDHAADGVASLRANSTFQDFIGGWVFPPFVALLLLYWMVEEDKFAIPTQFMLAPLAYIPFSIVGFTLVHAEFQFSYLFANPLIILTFGYAYVLFWAGFIKVLDKLKLVA